MSTSRDVVRSTGRIRRALITLTFGVAAFAGVGATAGQDPAPKPVSPVSVESSQTPTVDATVSVAVTPKTPGGGISTARAGIRW